jgi:hypothetical protein
MVKRFSIKAFIFATGVHLVGTIALLEASFHILREAKHSGVELDRVWLTAVSWIWEFLPMFVARVFPPRHHLLHADIACLVILRRCVFRILHSTLFSMATPNHLTKR